MTIYYFGNSLIEIDSMVPSIIQTVRGHFPHIEFRHTDPTEQWWEGNQNPVLIDTVVGLKTVSLFHDLNDFEQLHTRITPHDYDLLMDLALMKKIHKIDSFTLIGVPEKGDKQSIAHDVIQAIFSLS